MVRESRGLWTSDFRGPEGTGRIWRQEALRRTVRLAAAAARQGVQHVLGMRKKARKERGLGRGTPIRA